jgi:hypothetical protein
VARIIPFEEVVRARRRDRERREIAECVDILEQNLHLALRLFATAPQRDRPVRARQLRQLAEMLEYVVAGARLDEPERASR